MRVETKVLITAAVMIVVGAGGLVAKGCAIIDDLKTSAEACNEQGGEFIVGKYGNEHCVVPLIIKKKVSVIL